MRNAPQGFALLLTVVALLIAAPARPQDQPLRPRQLDAATLPAHDAHQGLLIAVSADTTAESSRAVFGKRSPYDVGVLGLQVYFKNDNDAPIRINLSTVRLLIGAPGDQRQKLEPLSAEDLTDLLLLKKQKDPTVRRSPLPRTPLKSDKGKDWDDLDALLRSDSMASDVLPPHTTVHGYFYFDIDHRFDWLSNARLDIPDLSFMLNNNALFFFQIDLDPAAPAATR